MVRKSHGDRKIYTNASYGTEEILRCGLGSSYRYYIISVRWTFAGISVRCFIITDEFDIFYVTPWSLNLMTRVEKS